MHGLTLRRIAIALVGAAVVAIWLAAAMWDEGTASAAILLASAAFVFGGIVLQLVDALLTADPKHRRIARQALLFCAAVPALLLALGARDTEGVDAAPLILLATAIWLALAMAVTSYLLVSGTRRREIRLVRLHPHRPTHFAGRRAVAVHARKR